MTDALSHSPSLISKAEEDHDDNQRFGVKVEPSDDFRMNTCDYPFPKRFSLLFKFKVENRRFVTTLFEVEDQLSIVLDLCNAQMIIGFGSSCAVNNITFSLLADLEADTWHRIGLSFEPQLITMFVNCELTQWAPMPDCSIECDYLNTSYIGIMTPATRAFCTSQGKVKCESSHSEIPNTNTAK